MTLDRSLSDAEQAELDDFLGRVVGGLIPNIEALDGFFAALACCPDLILPSEYLPVLQSGAQQDGDLVFETMRDAQRFMSLVNRHWNHVNRQLRDEAVYLPLVLEDAEGKSFCNDWANGFLTGADLRRPIWQALFEDELNSGPMVPIWVLAHEHDPDPEMRPYPEPITDERREDLLVGAAAGVMILYRHFLDQRFAYLPQTGTFLRPGAKTGRNDPCPCGSGRKFKQCCGRSGPLH